MAPPWRLLLLTATLCLAEDCAEDAVDWARAKPLLRAAVDSRSVTEAFLEVFAAASESACLPGIQTLNAIVSASRGAAEEYASPLPLGIKSVVAGGFPVFGALEWLAEALPERGRACGDDDAAEGFRELLWSYRERRQAVPSLKALQLLEETQCKVARAAALVALADGDEGLLESAERELLGVEDEAYVLGKEWPIFGLLHELGTKRGEEERTGCLLLIHVFPTEEIKRDTQEALERLERYFYEPLGVEYPLVVFVDGETKRTVREDFAQWTGAKVVPAEIPREELTREMSSYSCVDGVNCAAGAGISAEGGAHRGKSNSTQFWSPDYLRISRYTAGPLFLHPALDECRFFLKVDTDFFLTAPVEADPLAAMEREGTRLAYWQIHVQGQRQAGYMHAAMAYLEEKKIPIRNRAFHARGRFEEKAKELKIDVSEVPEALEAATLIYGCLFGGDVDFFREPLYRDFFQYMDRQKGFEERGWSNQFFLGTAAAAFLYPSQVARLYVAGQHQESRIEVAGGNVTEFLLGASHGVFR